MDRAEMVALIRGAVPEPGGVWADLGAGTGNFTRALAQLLGPRGTIYAVDCDGRTITHQRASLSAQGEKVAAIHPLQGDFTGPLDLPVLDGVLMANALHFVRDQGGVLAHVAGYLRPGGRFVLVEYALRSARPWVPFPLPFERFQSLTVRAGLSAPTLAGTRQSPSSGTVMYAAVAHRHGEGQANQ